MADYDALAYLKQHGRVPRQSDTKCHDYLGIGSIEQARLTRNNTTADLDCGSITVNTLAGPQQFQVSQRVNCPISLEVPIDFSQQAVSRTICKD